MPSLNSGTERPRAPLLEPYIILDLYFFTVDFSLTVIIKIFSLEIFQRMYFKFVRMLVSLGR